MSALLLVASILAYFTTCVVSPSSFLAGVAWFVLFLNLWAIAIGAALAMCESEEP